MKIQRLLCTAIAIALILPAVAATAEDGPVVWLSFAKAKRGQSNAYVQTVVKHNSELYGKLMAEGAALNWGIAQPINHAPDMNYTHVEFVAFKNWEGVNSFVTSFMAGMGAMSESERNAMQAEFDAVVEPGSHYDIVNRGLHIGGASQGRPAYLNLAFFKAQPGADFMSLYRAYAEPVMNQMSAAGKVGYYGVDEQELHGADPNWTHLVWYEMPGLGARDAMAAAFDAADAARSAEENSAMQAKFAATMTPGSHTDMIMAIVHYAEAGADE